MQTIINTLSTWAYTPDGTIADPNHPIYPILYLLTQLT